MSKALFYKNLRTHWKLLLAFAGVLATGLLLYLAGVLVFDRKDLPL